MCLCMSHEATDGLALSVLDSVDVDNIIFNLDRKAQNWKVCQGFCATEK